MGLTLAGLGALLCIVATVMLWPIDPAPYLDPRGSAEILDRHGRPLYAFLNRDEQWCFPAGLEDISPHLVAATIAVEDQRFRGHPGVDVRAVLRAALQNLRGREVVSGASTLTMQVVKQRDGSARSLWGKARQAITALRLERRASKDEILEAYLNLAPYGRNLVGCEAASRRYFNKPVKELTLAEAALLAGLPKSPVFLDPLDHPDRARRRRDYVLRRMEEEGWITGADRERAARQPLGARYHEYPALTPHLALRLRPSLEDGQRLVTTLDRSIQEAAESLVRRSVGNVRPDIGNAALSVVDVQSGEVLARLGSADFFDTPGGGQVDACRAPRSPGSALKPFTYALALDRGRLYPSEMLLDSVLDYGRFNPENFDERYRGLVSASDALRASLNVPAVTVLDRVGPREVQALLRRAGLTTLNKPADHYGLGLTLGNCEVRLEELAEAYTMLANLGVHRSLRILRDEESPNPKRLLSAGACAAVFQMLEQALPSELDGGAVKAAGVKPPLAWKTGTSSGHRDGWAFVFNRQYLVGAWMGNNDGRGSQKLFGAWSALPLAGRVFRMLPPRAGPAWPDVARRFTTAPACAVSGLPASPWCFQTRQEAFPKGQYLNRVCDMHYPAPGSEHEAMPRVVERWPGSAKGWDLARIDAGRDAPREEALRILSPAHEGEYVLTGEAGGDRIRLRSSRDEAAPIHWYMDELFLGTSEPRRPIYVDLTPGRHVLACMDAAGALARVEFEVVAPEGSVRFKD